MPAQCTTVVLVRATEVRRVKTYRGVWQLQTPFCLVSRGPMDALEPSNMPTGKERESASILVPDWLITSHVSLITCSDWLITLQIAPIFKKGNKCRPENYRPVALTSHLIKTFERIVRTQLSDYVENSGILNEEQHGFRAGRSCLTQLLLHYDSILESLNSGLEVDVAYIDFEKAFDKVDIQVLLEKLQRYGVTGKLFKWIQAFLTGRSQTVVVEGCRSRMEAVISSVIQGSVLGPLLFIIYIADLVSGTTGKLGTFADDTKIGQEIKDLSDRDSLQRDLTLIEEWSRKNNMALHEKKFQVLNYRLNSTKPLRALPFNTECYFYFNPNGDIIEAEFGVKDLGIYLTEDGKFNFHIATIATEAKRIAGWALGVFRNRSKRTLLTLFKALVRPKLEYCSALWSPTSIGDIAKLEGVQRFYTRRIEECSGMDYWERLKFLGIQSLQRRRERFMIIHLWKVYHGLVPNHTNRPVDDSFKVHPRRGVLAEYPDLYTAAQDSIETIREGSFSVRSVKLFNRMPKEVRGCETLEDLKVSLGKFLDGIPDHPPVRGYRSPNDNSLVTLLPPG